MQHVSRTARGRPHPGPGAHEHVPLRVGRGGVDVPVEHPGNPRGRRYRRRRRPRYRGRSLLVCPRPCRPYRGRARAASTLCSARNLSSCFRGAIWAVGVGARRGQSSERRGHPSGARGSWRTVGKSGGHEVVSYPRRGNGAHLNRVGHSPGPPPPSKPITVFARHDGPRIPTPGTLTPPTTRSAAACAPSSGRPHLSATRDLKV